MSWSKKDLDEIERKILRETPRGWKPVGPVVALANADKGDYVALLYQIIPKGSK